MRRRRVLPRLALALGMTPLVYASVSACGDVTSDAVVRRIGASPACSNDGQCAGATHVCDLDEARCVECLGALDCDSGQICSLPARRCVAPCSADTCADSEPVCDGPSGFCRACAGDGECDDDTPHCLASGACVECLDSMDCEDDSDKFCNGAGRCVECLSDGHCGDQDEKCSLDLGKCATPCSASLTCGSSDDPICDPSIGFCVECLSDFDCDADETCRSWKCSD